MTLDALIVDPMLQALESPRPSATEDVDMGEDSTGELFQRAADHATRFRDAIASGSAAAAGILSTGLG